MENFLNQFLPKDVIFSSNKLHGNVVGDSESSVNRFIQKIIYKPDVVVDLKSMLNSAFSSEKVFVKNQMVKKILTELHRTLLLDIDDCLKVDVFRCMFEAFVGRCKEDENVVILQFFVLLCYLLGLKVSSQEKKNNQDDCGIVDESNFETIFEVRQSSPSSVSLKIFNQLLLSLSKRLSNINFPELEKYHKWINKLIKYLAKCDPFENVMMEIFCSVGYLDVKILEGNLDSILGKILTLKNYTKDFAACYESFIVESFKICAKFKRCVKFITRFLSNIKSHGTALSASTIAPPSFLSEFSKTIVFTSSQQSLGLMEVLAQSFADSCLPLSQNKSDTFVALSVTSELVVNFLKNVKIFAPTISSATFHSFLNQLNFIKNTLKQFGQFLLSDKDFILMNEFSLKIYLSLSLYCNEIQTLIDCYKDSVFLAVSSASTQDHDWQCCISLDEWNTLSKIVLKLKLETCASLCFQLALQKLRTSRVEKPNETLDNSSLKMILSQFSADASKFNIFLYLQPEDMTLLVGILSTKQTKSAVKKLLKQILTSDKEEEAMAWLSDSHVQECPKFTVILLSELVKETGDILSKVLGDKDFSKLQFFLDDYFKDGVAVITEKFDELPGKVNSLLLKGNKIKNAVAKNLNQNQFFKKMVKILKLLPLVYLDDDFRQVALTFSISIAIITSSDDFILNSMLETVFTFLNCKTDASVCFNIGFCIKWLSELSCEKSKTDEIRVRVIEALVRNCPDNKFGLSQIGEAIDSADAFKHTTSLKLIESQFTLYQQLGKCWVRVKKRKADYDLIGDCRKKLAKVLLEGSKELEEVQLDNYNILFKIAVIELNNAVLTNNENEISHFVKLKFQPYFDFAVQKLKNGHDESCLLFLSAILQSMATIGPLVPEKSIHFLWTTARLYGGFNWRLFTLNTTEQQFRCILDDLLSITKEYLNPESCAQSLNYFEIWAAFFDSSSGLKRETCQIHAQNLFDFILDGTLTLVDLPIHKKIYLAKFFCYCISHERVILTCQMLDTIFHVIPRFLEDPLSMSSDHFLNLFATGVHAGSAFLSKEFAWSPHKAHLTYTLFHQLLTFLVKRSQRFETSTEDAITLSTCAFSVEKWVSLMKKRERDFARMSAYFIATIVSTVASVAVPLPVKNHLLGSLNHFLSISDSNTISYLLRILKPGYQQVFKGVYEKFKMYHKYTGKV